MSRPFPFRLFLFAFLGWTFDFYDLALYGFIKEVVSKDLHIAHMAESWMGSVALATSGVGGILAGMLADRYGKRSLLALTVLVYSLGSLVCGVAPSALVFMLGRGLVGLGVGGEWAIGHGMVAESVENKFRGRASALLQAGEPVGVALAALAGFIIMPIVGWRAVLVASSATAILALFIRRSMRLPNEPAHRGGYGLMKAVRNGLGKHMFMAWVLVMLKLGTYWTCYLWLPGFLRDRMGQGIGKSFAWIVTAQVGQFLGMLTFGSFADRHGRRPAYSIYSLLTAIALALLAFRWQWLAVHPPFFWCTMLLLGFGSGCTAGFGALLSELFPTEVRSSAMGTTYNLGRAAQPISLFVVTLMVARYGLTGGLSVPLVLAIGTASWVWLLPETRGIVLPRLFMSPRANPGASQARSAVSAEGGEGRGGGGTTAGDPDSSAGRAAAEEPER
ncbi:MAG TPA: MFS transporter [Pseudomonadota bacterium]|nr:MFS transporter [Pseudomonadota bacterium]